MGKPVTRQLVEDPGDFCAAGAKFGDDGDRVSRLARFLPIELARVPPSRVEMDH
jgi:hypothetical protein